MTFFTKLLEGYGYRGADEFICSLAPSLKYNMTFQAVGVSAVVSAVEIVFGLNWLAFLGLLVVMFWELVSGCYAALVKNEAFSSAKFSRFGFKSASYLILIAVPYLFSRSFNNNGQDIAGGLFTWIHIFLTVNIVVENIISIMENQAVISGKDKTHWITKLRAKTDQLF